MFYSRLRWKIKDLKDKVSEQEVKINILQRRCHIAEDHITWHEKTASELREEIENARHKIKELWSENDTLRHDQNMVDEQFAAANEEILRLQEENEELKKDVKSYQGQVRVWSRNFHNLSDSYDDALKKIDKYETESTETLDDYRKRRTACKVLELEVQIAALIKENDHLREELKKKEGCPCDKRRKH